MNSCVVTLNMEHCPSLLMQGARSSINMHLCVGICMWQLDHSPSFLRWQAIRVAAQFRKTAVKADNDQDDCPAVLRAGLASLLAKVFVPGFTSESLRKVAEADPGKYIVAKKGGILGIEEILDYVEDHLGSFVLG